MPPRTDTIMTFSDLMQDHDFGIHMQVTGIGKYEDYLAVNYQRSTGATKLPEFLPISFSNPPSAHAQVNNGRWIWQCLDCLSGVLLDTTTWYSICPECGNNEKWTKIIWPRNRIAIEAELLKQPGFRARAPVRQWKPGWTLQDLEARTAKANELRAAGISPVRALSIGAVNIWVSGEILTASLMNTYINELFEDLAGRNGTIQLEDALEVNDGAGHYLRVPRLTSTQRAAVSGVNGRILYDSTLGRFYLVRGSSWRQVGTMAERDVHISTNNPTNSGWKNGDIWFVRAT